MKRPSSANDEDEEEDTDGGVEAGVATRGWATVSISDGSLALRTSALRSIVSDFSAGGDDVAAELRSAAAELRSAGQATENDDLSYKRVGVSTRHGCRRREL